jgi:hypothetical protein
MGLTLLKLAKDNVAERWDVRKFSRVAGRD